MPISVIIIIPVFVYSLKSAYIYWFKKQNMEYNHKR